MENSPSGVNSERVLVEVKAIAVNPQARSSSIVFMVTFLLLYLMTVNLIDSNPFSFFRRAL